MALYEALNGRRCRSPIYWFEVGEVELIGLDLVHQAIGKVKIIQERLKTKQSRQKSYTNVSRRDLDFEVDAWVYFKNFMGDPSLIVPTENIGIKNNLSYEEVPVQILDR
ncbi:uncharacterized protein LOC125861567 [Solanum stenotomum]|uniref:uncharacterized protein LOC125861567 n=1 Tax=Solanum stenotomum TaxID=172797 RepID=UPI0020D0DB14|nr:uncharacterized protein LOC125861567 [Solanum stenotomum]